MTCVECGDDYVWSPARARLGGKRTHCSSCCEETTVRYVGTSAGEGKQAAVQVLKFDSEADRAAYVAYFQNASGLHKGKGCQIGRGLKSTPNVKFKTLATFTGNVNHKGKS